MAQHKINYRKTLQSALRNRKLSDALIDSIHDLQVFAAANGGTIDTYIIDPAITRSTQSPYVLNNTPKYGAYKLSSYRKTLQAALTNKALANKMLNVLLELQDYAGIADNQQSTIAAVADVAGSLDGTYFILEDATNGTVAFWINLDDGVTTEPVHGADVGVEITTVTTGMSAADVGTAIYTAIIAEATFEAGSDDLAGNLVIQNVEAGYFANVDAGDSGFTVAVSDGGSAAADQDKMVIQSVSASATPFTTANLRALTSSLCHASLASDLLAMILELQTEFRDNKIGTCSGTLTNALIAE